MNGKIVRMAAAGLGGLVLALGMQSPASAAADDKKLTVKGCSEQCITKAWLTGRAPTLELEVETTVPAKIRVEASTELPMQTASGPKFAAPAVKVSTGNQLKSEWTTDFGPLKSGTTYHVVAWATDQNGKSAYQKGTFTTPKAAPGKDQNGGGGTVKTKGDGCDLQCISKAWVNPGRGSAALEVKTEVPSRMQVKASTFEPMQTTSGPHFNVVHAAASSGADFRTEWDVDLDGLEPGTTYHVVVWATDEEGRTAYQQGTFLTHEAVRRVKVTFNRIRIISDGDKYTKGEVELFLAVNNEYRPELHQGTKTVKSGSSHGLPWNGGRAGTVVMVIEDAPQWLNLRVQGVEHDEYGKGPGFQFCSEGTPPFAGLSGGESTCLDYATAGEHLDLDTLFPGLAHPVEFETTSHHLKFRVEAEVTVTVEDV
ncbi:MAG TPA: hypothetical protein VF244_06940 [Acidimicrobiales bacterium]